MLAFLYILYNYFYTESLKDIAKHVGEAFS